MRPSTLAWILAAAAITVPGCGGGEAAGVIGFIPPGSGQVYIDADPSTAAYEPLACQSSGNECRLSLTPDTAKDLPPYERHFRYSGQSIPDAILLTTPQIDPCSGGAVLLSQDVVDMGACFKGRFIDPMTAVSADGKQRFFWSGGFNARIGQGVWVNADDATEEIHITQTQNTSEVHLTTDFGVGCQKNGGKISPVSLAATYSNGLTPNIPRYYLAYLYYSGTTPEWTGSYQGQGAIRLRDLKGNQKTLLWKSATPSCT